MEGEGAQAPVRPGLVLLVVLVGQLLIVGAVGSMNIALPAIREDLHASPAEMQWVLVLYQLGFASLLVTGGRVGDLLGRKRVFVAGLAAFVAASALAAAAPTAAVLLGARLLQGIAGGMTSPQVLAMIQQAFPPAERPRAFAAFGMVSGSAFMVGQLVTGGLIEVDPGGLGWRAAMVVNVVIGALAVPMAARVLPRSERHAGQRLDLAGVALGTVTAVLVLYPLIQGRSAGWPAWLLALLVLAAPALWLFLRVERGVAEGGGDPLVDLGLFSLRSFRGGLLVAVAFGFCTLPTFYVLTLTLQLGFSFDALQAALATAPTPIAVVATSLLSARLLPRYGRRVIGLAGVFCLAAGGALMLTLVVAPRPLNALHLVPALVLQGCGNGLGMTSLVNLTLAEVPEVSAGSASGLYQTVQQGTSAVGVAVAGVLFFGVVGAGSGTDAYVDGMLATLVLTIVCGIGVLALHRLLPAHAARHPAEEDVALALADG